MDIRRKKLIKSSSVLSIAKLVEQAREAFDDNKPDRSSRYITMAFDLIKKNKVNIPKELRNSFCRKCHVVWVPGKTVSAYYDTKDECLRLKCSCGYTKRI